MTALGASSSFLLLLFLFFYFLFPPPRIMISITSGPVNLLLLLLLLLFLLLFFFFLLLRLRLRLLLIVVETEAVIDGLALRIRTVVRYVDVPLLIVRIVGLKRANVSCDLLQRAVSLGQPAPTIALYLSTLSPFPTNASILISRESSAISRVSSLRVRATANSTSK